MKTTNTILTNLVPILLGLAAASGFSADRFDPQTQPLGVIAPIELANTDLANGTAAYRPWFENGSWQGDLVEYTVTPDGKLSTNVDLSGSTPAYTPTTTNWSANVEFRIANQADANYWQTREIITYDSASKTQVSFRWPSLSTAQKQALDQTSYDAGRNWSPILTYLRGNRKAEVVNGGAYRTRSSLLGDIIHSNPVHVGPPNESYSQAGYASWAALHKNRDSRVFVGANDGMLHAFDADDGKEAWAFIPSAVLGSLDRLAGRPYSHLYSVDGLITVRDAYAGAWKTVLVAGLGAGGKDWFALDVTSPDLDENENTGTNSKVMWELSSSAPSIANDLGHSFGQAVITRLNDGNWYAIMGNGYNSKNGIAKLFIINLATGAAAKAISTGSGSADSPNGLSSPTLSDLDGDGKADVAYAGDIDGNLWKFDLSSTSKGSWGVAFGGKPLHDGMPTRPITQAPDVTLHPQRGVLVFFATGKLHTADDVGNADKQAIYGIWDLRGSEPPIPATQALQEQTLSEDLAYTSGTDIAETVRTFTPEPGIIDWTEKDGWVVELPEGFHVITPVALRGGRVKAALHNSATDENYALEPNYVDGGAPPDSIFDLNRDDVLDDLDKWDGNKDDDILDSDDIVAMWKLPEGLMSQTIIGRISNGVDAQIINYLVPPVVDDACTGDCSGGFLGGHIDVDTDYWNDGDGGVGDKTFKHTHEYDKEVGRVYVDYRDHDVVDGHVTIDESGYLPQSDKWIAVIANADLSPGSVLTLDDRQYNVVDYQRMIQRKMRTWNGKGSALTDDSGKTLIFSMDDLKSSGGTVRHDFDDMSILAGGLHPSNTGCVRDGDSVTNGRYRNGALVTQFINLDVFTACSTTGCSLDKVIVQNPTDLPEEVLYKDESRMLMSEDLNKDGVIKKEDYEVYGGIRGKAVGKGNDALLFESTIFWHYKGGACYGESNYESEVDRVIDELVFTQEDFDKLLADEGITDLDAAYDAVLECLEIDDGDKDCKKRLETIEELYDLQTEIVDLGGDSSDDTGLDSTGEEPVIMGGEASDLGVTAGPNFQAGRRTWTEIFND